MSPRILLLRFLRRWHARIGFAAVWFFLILAVTGLVLNHGSDLGLDAKYLHASWLARWYGLKSEPPRGVFLAGHHELIAGNGRWLLDGRLFGDRLPQPVGLVEVDDKLVVASRAALYLYRDDGELIDRLDRDALPAVPISAAGSGKSGKSGLVLRTGAGIFSSEDVMSWRPAPRRDVTWSAPAELSVAERRTYEETLVPGISVQRVLLDLHSGRFAGRYGPLAVDTLAVMLAALSLSGAWLFLRPRHHRREPH